MNKKYNADNLVIANLELNDKGRVRRTGKYIFNEKYSKVSDMPLYKEILTKKKYVNYIYAHYAVDFYLVNLERYTNRFPEDRGKTLDEATILKKTEEIRRNSDKNEKGALFSEDKEISRINKTMERKQKKYINKQVRKYTRDIQILIDGKLATTLILDKLPGMSLAMGLSGIITFLLEKTVNKKFIRDMDYRYAQLSSEEQKEYKEIIEQAKNLYKIKQSKKLARFIKNYEVSSLAETTNEDALNYCVENNKKIREKETKTTVIGTLEKEEKSNLNIYLSREELNNLLDGKQVVINDMKIPLEISMRQDVYSAIDQNPEALKENARHNKRMIKKRG